VARAALVTGIAFGLTVPIVSTAIKASAIIYNASTIGSTFSGLAHGIFEGDWGKLSNTGKLFLDNFLFGCRSWIRRPIILQGVLRFSWELPQTASGYGYSQIRNSVGGVDRIDYFGGATFSTGENRKSIWGVSLGNFINTSISNKIEGSFKNKVLSDPLYMHEYGHTSDSRVFGPMYFVRNRFTKFRGCPVDRNKGE
jgi:hypothetical protein